MGSTQEPKVLLPPGLPPATMEDLIREMSAIDSLAAPEPAVPVSYTDEEITIALPVYRNIIMAEWCLENLRKCLPACRVMIIPDADRDPRWPKVAEKFNAECHLIEQRTYHDPTAPLWRHIFGFYNLKPTKYLLKIDPDTGFHRRPKHMGDADYFGCVFRREWVSGGFIGLRDTGIAKLLPLSIWTAFDIRDPVMAYLPRTPLIIALVDHIRQMYADIRRVQEDMFMGLATAMAGIPRSYYDEFSNEDEYVPNPGQRYAITHPCKHLRL